MDIPFTAKKVKDGPLNEKPKIIKEATVIVTPFSDGVFVASSDVEHKEFGPGYIRDIKPGGLAICVFNGSLRTVHVDTLKLLDD